MNALSAIANRKHRKNDASSDQLNAQAKCMNEKRRRELENAYISELAELISTSDMAQSSKKDKCVILQETVDQIKSIKHHQESVADAVQQGEVSSSRPAIYTSDFGPLLLEALEAFGFIVNSDYRIEYITDNVFDFIRYRGDELLGNSIFNFIHHSDHQSFSSGIVPVIQGASYGYQTDSSHKSRSVSCRILVKSGVFDNGSAPETMDHVQQQQRVNEYENMEISILKKMKSPESLGLGGELSSGLGGQDCSDGQLLVCMARKVPDTKPLAPQQLQQQQQTAAVSAPSETIITRLDACGKVLSIDTQNLAPTRAPYFTQELVGQSLLGLTCRSDQPRLASYMDRVMSSSEQGPHHLDEIRIRGTMPNKYFRIQTRSRRFKSPDHNFFINAIHTITGEECMLEPVASPRPALLTSSPAAAAVGPATSVHQMCSSVSLPSPVVVSSAFQYRSGHQPSPADSAASSTITLNASDGFSTLTVASDAYTDNDLFSELFSDSGGGFSAASPQPPVNSQQYSMPPRTSVATPTPLSRPSSRQQSLPPTPTPCHPQQQQQQQSSPYHYQYSPAAAAPPPADNNNGQLKGLLAVRSLSTDTKDNNLLQGLLGCVDEVDVKPPPGMVSSMNVIGNHIINNNNSTISSKQPASSGGGDNMLRQLLNDRNEQRVKAKKNEELMLLLNGGPTAARTAEQLVGVSAAEMRRTSGSGSVGVPSPLLVSGDVYDGGTTGDLMCSQKRPSQDDDSDIIQQSKRSAVRYPSGGGMVLEMSGGGIVSTGQQLTLGDASQQLQQAPGLPSRNKMLAELLARSCNQSPAVPTTIAQQARPSDLPQNKLPRKEELQRKLQTHGRIAVTAGGPGMQLFQQQQEDPMLLLGGSNRPQQQQHHQQQHHQQLQIVSRHMAPSGNPAVRGGVGVAVSAGAPGLYSGMSTGSGPAAVAASNSGGDSELDNIIDDIIAFEEKYQVNSGVGPRPVDVASNMNEKKAIHEIQQSLMQAENNMRGFPQAQQTAVARSAPGYPPPGYHLSRGQVGGLTSQINMVRTQMSLYPGVSQNRLTNQQVVQRQRLLQQQQQQRLLVNNQSGGSVADQLTTAAGAAFQNMDDILNTTPPNVSLQQRLSGGQQESQGSPAYSPSVVVSPQSHQMSPAPQAVSPRSPGMAAAFPGGFAATQMSPRAAGSVPSPYQPQPSPGGQQQQSVSQQPPVSVVQSRMVAVATGKLQQQNPELNAQLSGTFGIRGQSYQLPQRNAPMLRATGVVQHQQQQQQQQLYHHHQQQQQLLRLQRPPATAAVSLPPGQIQMSGGRHYGAEQLPKMLPPPPHSHPHGYAGYPQMSHSLQPQMMPHMDMYAAMDDRLQHPAGVLSVSGHQQQAGLVGGSGSSDFVRQELRRAIVGQQRHHSMPGGVATLPTATGEPPPRPGGRSLTQEDLEELGLEVPTVAGEHTRWSNHVAGGSMAAAAGLMTAGDQQQLQPPAAAPPHSAPAAINSNHPAMPSSLLRDLLMSD